jgi:NAD(P)H dehydrogenase (quinone)
MSTILVTGATGHLGRAVAQQLLQNPHNHTILALVRDLSKGTDLEAAGATLRQADYNDYASLVAAFQGVDKLYFVSSSDVPNRSAQHENVVKAATEAGVGHVFYTSFQRKTDDDRSPIAFVAAGHLHAENLLRASGLRYTLLKHALYTDVLPMFLGQNVLETGTIFLPAGEGRASFATRQDMAEAGAKLLLSTEPVVESYDIAGPQSHSLADVAAILSELAGKPVQYVSPSGEEFEQQLSSFGVPAEGIQGALTFCQAIAQGEFDFPTTTLAELLGREPESVKSYLKQAYSL